MAPIVVPKIYTLAKGNRSSLETTYPITLPFWAKAIPPISPINRQIYFIFLNVLNLFLDKAKNLFLQIKMYFCTYENNDTI